MSPKRTLIVFTLLTAFFSLIFNLFLPAWRAAIGGCLTALFCILNPLLWADLKWGEK